MILYFTRNAVLNITAIKNFIN